MRKYRLTLHAIESEMREGQSYQKLREPYAGEEAFWKKSDDPNPQFGYVPSVSRVDVSRDVFVMELTDIDTTALLRAVLDVAASAEPIRQVCVGCGGEYWVKDGRATDCRCPAREAGA